jgi:hypothetical protein
MRRMAGEGFKVERHPEGQRITHADSSVFGAYGFVSEESAEGQLTLLDEPGP